MFFGHLQASQVLYGLEVVQDKRTGTATSLR